MAVPATVRTEIQTSGYQLLFSRVFEQIVCARALYTFQQSLEYTNFLAYFVTYFLAFMPYETFCRALWALLLTCCAEEELFVVCSWHSKCSEHTVHMQWK